MGAELSVTEMVSAKAVTFGDKKTFNLARIGADEGNVSLQIFGSEPDVMARAAAELESGYSAEGFVPPVAIDINMGCPVHKIFSNGEGSALMKDPELIYRITRSVKENISIPVTVKIRSGVDEKHINAVECALAAESAGASLVTVHGRTRTMLYSGVADREIIKNVKDSLHIPVVANGDVTDVETALAMLGETGADGIMIGRGAVGNPYLFAQIRAALEGKMFCVPTLEEKRKTALLQLRLAIEDKGETVAVNEARKQIAIYFKGFRGSATLRAKINAATTYAEVEAALEEVK
jgi:nifR3 family TIM-barrel protein